MQEKPQTSNPIHLRNDRYIEKEELPVVKDKNRIISKIIAYVIVMFIVLTIAMIFLALITVLVPLVNKLGFIGIK